MEPPMTPQARTLLRIEGLAVLGAASILYAATGASWWLFVALLFVPDVSMAGYLAGPRAGAALYNAGHSYLGPILLWALSPQAAPIALIWGAHVGMDRALGYGLKGASFAETHLGVLDGGRARA